MTHGVELNSKNVVLVLGMHRSGTSAIAAGLEKLGLLMGSSLARADEWNPKGYFEERRIVEFNDRLLEMGGCRWDSPLPPGTPQPSEWTQQLDPAAALLEEIFGHAAAWGFKDPRMCLLPSFWRQVFASMHVTPRLLFILRHPAEVAHSLARRDGISGKRAGLLWLTHLLGSLDYLQDESDCRLVDFSELLSHPARLMNGLSAWLGLSCEQEAIEQFSQDFISPGLSHGADAGSIEMPPLVLRAYEYWRSVAASGAFTPASLQAPEWVDIKDEFEREVKPVLAVVHGFFAGDRQLAFEDARLRTMSEGLAIAERLALERLDKLTALDAQLKETSDALASVQQLAIERLGQIELLDQQLKQTREALAHAEKLALERLTKLEEK